jgi:hypothetical protein
VHPRVIQHPTMPLYLGGFRHCRVSQGSGSRLSAQACSSTATCLMTPDLTPPRGWAPGLPHIAWLRNPPLHARGLWSPHAPHSSPQVIGRNKERLSCNRHAAMLPCYRGTPTRCITEAPARRVDIRCYHDLQNVQAGSQCTAARLMTRGCG